VGGRGLVGSVPGAGEVQGMEEGEEGGSGDATPPCPGQLPSANQTEEGNWSKSGSLMFLCLKLKAQQHETT